MTVLRPSSDACTYVADGLSIGISLDVALAGSVLFLGFVYAKVLDHVVFHASLCERCAKRQILLAVVDGLDESFVSDAGVLYV